IGTAPGVVQSVAYELALGRRAPDDGAVARLSDHDRAQALEIGYAYLYYLFLGRDIDAESAKPRMRKLLIARSRVPVESQGIQPPVPDTRPDEGHPTARLALSGGRLEKADFVELRLR